MATPRFDNTQAKVFRTLVFPCLIAGYALLIISVRNATPNDKDRWNRKYQTEHYNFGKTPIAFLREHIDLLPKGKALDIAMGGGRNGVFLATRGFRIPQLELTQKL